MDDEMAEALELSRDDLVAKLVNGRPAVLAGVRPARQATVTVVHTSRTDVLQRRNSAAASIFRPTRKVRDARVTTL